MKKRILTFIMAAAALCQWSAASAATATIFEGSHKYVSGWGSEKLALKVNGHTYVENDKIIVTYTGNGSDQQIQIAASIPGNESSWKNLFDYADLNGSSYTHTLTSEQAGWLNGDGVYLTFNGQNYTITKVELESTADLSGVTVTKIPADVEETYEGTVLVNDFGTWSAGSDWPVFTKDLDYSTFKAGDVIAIYHNGGSVNIQLGFKDTNVSDAPEGFEGKDASKNMFYFQIGSADYVNTSDNPYKIKINKAFADALNASGAELLFRSDNLNPKCITVIPADKPDEPDPVVEETELCTAFDSWTGGSSWLPVFYKDFEYNQFYPGDQIAIYHSAASSVNIQIGFSDATVTSAPSGFVYKNDDSDTNGHCFYFQTGGADYVNTSANPYIFTINEEFAEALNRDGVNFCMCSDNLPVTKITVRKTGSAPRKAIWVPLFVPGEYPEGVEISGKTAYGTNFIVGDDGNITIGDEQSGKPKGLTAWIGTARVVKDEDSGKLRVQFYNEWWTKDELEDTSNQNYDHKRKFHGTEDWQLNELNTYPLRLTRENTPNFSRLKVGDMIRFTFTCYEDGEQEKSEANLGTYDPEKISNLTDPYSGYVGITVGSDGANYKEFGNGTHTVTVDYTVGPVMLDYITRYGLSINGRKYYLDSVMAKIYTEDDEEDPKDDPTEADDSKTLHRYLYNVKFTPDDLKELYPNTLLNVHFVDGNVYNEHIQSFYNSNGLFLNDKTEYPETDQTVPEDNDDSFRIMVRYLDTDNTYQRLHVASYLLPEHFEAHTDEPATAPRKAPKKTVPNPHIVPIDGIQFETAVDQSTGKRTLGIRVVNGDLANLIKQQGLEVRGTRYLAELGDFDQSLTGIEDVTADSAIDYNAPYETYNLQGVRVADPVKGNLYIVRQGDKVEKVIIR